MKSEKKPFGHVDGKNISLYTLTNDNGLEMNVTNYGCIITSFFVPDAAGKKADIVLGYNSVDGYLKETPYFGAVIGRFGNRICKGRFVLNGNEYVLPINNGENSLHGGLKGFDKVVWDATEVKTADAVGVSFSYISKDMEQGFPGTMNVTVVYWLTNKNEYRIEYTATTDKNTIVNLTQHNYWNLAGEDSGDVLSHVMTINGDSVTPVDAGLIPTGVIVSVKGTPMDFTTGQTIGSRINENYDQLIYGGGYDHNWVLNQKKPGELTHAATVYDPQSGRVMDVATTEPGMQFYSGNFLDSTIMGKTGKPYNRRNGFCLETQHFPDSPNKPNFPTTVLKPGQTYTSTTVYTFSVK